MTEDELIEKLSDAAFEIDSECDAILEARRFLAMMKAYEKAQRQAGFDHKMKQAEQSRIAQGLANFMQEKKNNP